jgi:hypothetical protein
VIQYIPPVAENVHDDAAVVFLLVVPRRTLSGLEISVEDPVAELSANGIIRLAT